VSYIQTVALRRRKSVGQTLLGFAEEKPHLRLWALDSDQVIPVVSPLDQAGTAVDRTFRFPGFLAFHQAGVGVAACPSDLRGPWTLHAGRFGPVTAAKADHFWVTGGPSDTALEVDLQAKTYRTVRLGPGELLRAETSSGLIVEDQHGRVGLRGAEHPAPVDWWPDRAFVGRVGDRLVGRWGRDVTERGIEGSARVVGTLPPGLRWGVLSRVSPDGRYLIGAVVDDFGDVSIAERMKEIQRRKQLGIPVERSLWVVTVGTGEVRKLSDQPVSTCWSHDSEHLYVSRSGELLKVRLSDLHEERVSPSNRELVPIADLGNRFDPARISVPQRFS
jgi:hypothetical protein